MHMAPPCKPLFVTPVVEDEEGRTITRTMRRSDRLKDLTDFYYAMVPAAGESHFVDSYREAC